MKKLQLGLFFLFLSALFVGCGGGGGGGVGIPLTPAESVTFEAEVPASTLNANTLVEANASVRAALIPEDIQIFLEGVPLVFAYRSGESLIYRLTFSAENASFTQIIENGGGGVELMIMLGTKEAVRQRLELNTRTGGSSTKKLMITMRITNNIRNGTYGVEIFGGQGVGPIGAPGQSNKSLGVTGIDYLATSGDYFPLANATDVPVIDTTFRITFDSLVEHATNNFRIVATSESGSSVTLVQNDIGTLFSLDQTDIPETTTVPAYSYLTVTLIKNNKDGKFLHHNTEYTLSFESASVRRVDDPFVKLRPFTVLKRTFTTISN